MDVEKNSRLGRHFGRWVCDLKSDRTRARLDVYSRRKGASRRMRKKWRNSHSESRRMGRMGACRPERLL